MKHFKALLLSVWLVLMAPLPLAAQEDDGLLDLDLEQLMNLEVIQVTIPGRALALGR
jgi:hypothetical protein